MVATQEQEPAKSRGLLAVANDTVIEAANAAAGGLSSAANFIKPGNAVSGWIDKNIIQAGEESQSDVVKASKKKFREGVENADGVMGELGAVGSYIAENPLLAAAQAAGSFVGPGAAVKGAGMVGRAAGLGAKGIERAGRAGGVAAGAAMAGGDAAGTAYDLAIKAGATEEEATAAARQASVIPALVGGAGGAFGAEKLLAGAKGFGGGAAARAAKTGLSEAAQEAVEEGVTQYEGQRAAVPFDPSIDPSKGVAAAAGMGAALGGMTGAGTSLFTGGHAAGQPSGNPLDEAINQRATEPGAPSQPLALPAPTITVDGTGVARTADDRNTVLQRGADGSFVDMTEVPGQAPLPDPEMLALPAPVIQVDGVGNAITSEDRNAQAQQDLEARAARRQRLDSGDILDVTPVPHSPGFVPPEPVPAPVVPERGALSRAANLGAAATQQAAPAMPTLGAQNNEQPDVAVQGIDADTGEITAEARAGQIQEHLDFLSQMGRTQGWTNEALAKRTALQQELDLLSPAQRMADLNDQAAEAEARAADWAGRLYRPNPTELPEHAAKGGPVDIQEANEQRRLKNIQQAQQEAAAARAQVDQVEGEGNAQAQLAAQQDRATRSTQAAPDILNKQGKPFTVKLPAVKAAQAAGAGWEPVKVDGGYVVRQVQPSASPAPTAPTAPKGEAPAVQEATAKAEEIAREGNAQRQQTAQADQDAGARWDAMQPDAQRAVLAAVPKMAKVIRQNLEGKAWEKMSAGNREKVLSAMNSVANSAEQKNDDDATGGKGPKTSPASTTDSPTDYEAQVAELLDPKHPRSEVTIAAGDEIPESVLRAQTSRRNDPGYVMKPGKGGTVLLTSRTKNAQPAAPKVEGKDLGNGWAAFAPESGTKAVPRAQMPQIKAEHRGAMVNFMNARGIAHQEETVSAASLKPTQAEFSREKVKKALGYEGGDRSILVSQDGHVLDGHHQWMAAREQGKDVKTIRLDAPIEQLLEAAHDFPSSTTSSGATAAAPVKPEPPEAAVPVPAEKLASVRKSSAARAAEAEKGRAEYFAPGNIVKSYGGHDRVIAYTAPDADGQWSVKVQAVRKEGDAWVNEPNEGERTHATPPDARQLKAGPVQAANADAEQAASFRRSSADEGAGADFDVDGFLQAMDDGQPVVRARAEAVSAVQKTVDAIRAGWANGPEVTVVYDMADPAIPAAARRADQAQRSGGADGDPEGFYYGGKAYLLASQLHTDKDVARVLMHEALGHHGLRGVFGTGLDSVLEQIVAVRRGDVRRKAAEYGLDYDKPAHRLQAAEEVLAEWAQTRPEMGFVRRAVAAIRSWLRQHVPGFKGMRVTDDELIRAYILPARGWVERGAGAGMARDIAFSRTSATSMPDAIIGSTLGSASSHPDYAAAKAGDIEAAFRLAQDIVTPELVAKVRAAIGDSKPVVVPVAAEEATGRNRIPVAAAGVLAQRLGLSTSGAIVQANRAHRTGMDGLDRIFAPVDFAGVVEAKPYLLVDDTLTQGGTFAALASHIREGGGTVAGVIALTGKQYSAKIQPSVETLASLRQKHGDLENEFRAATGYGFDSLTESEARYLARYEPADRLRDRISAEGHRGRAGEDQGNAGPGSLEDGPLFSRSRLADLKGSALSQLDNILSHPGKVSMWDKTVGTMRHLAERNPFFKPVYESAQQNIDDVSMLANDAADQAPRILPRVDSMGDIVGKNRKRPVSAADNKAVARPLFEGTLLWARDLNGQAVLVEDLTKKYANLSAHNKAAMLLKANRIDAGVLAMWQGLPAQQYENMINSRFESKILKAGVVWSDKELQSQFGATPDQISLYREARAAIDRSIDMTARADMMRTLGDEYAAMRDAVLEQPSMDSAAQLLLDMLEQDAKAVPDNRDRLAVQMQQIRKRLEDAKALQTGGYAPLSRFGRYTVDVVDAAGERQYFGMYETMREANTAARNFRLTFPDAKVEQGTMSQQAYKLFAGVTPESLELFGNMLGLDSEGNEAQDKAFQEYLKLTKNNHSALKRMIHRKGTSGFSEDVGRVVANFVYSNARQAAAGLNVGT
ncbi:PLxRFG domain-containing protein, partial [Comamonas testosteroni]|uniref:PLxRFG domain-containing protein n=1 Tax=Comamonas testosteroni TaxID=285 RepID=UPI0012D735A4